MALDYFDLQSLTPGQQPAQTGIGFPQMQPGPGAVGQGAPPGPGQVTGGAEAFAPVIERIQSMTPEEREALKIKMEMSGQPPPPVPSSTPAVPGQPLPEATEPSTWSTFIDNIADPTSASNLLLNVGANILQPRQAGTSGLSHIVSGTTQALDKFGQAKTAKGKAATQTRVAEAGISKTERDIKSADVMDDLAAARAELARAQAAGVGGEGNAKLKIFDTTANALFKSFPEKYKTLDEARVSLRQFEITKGDTPESKAVVQLMENLPYMDEERVQPTLDTINEVLGGAGTPEAGATVQREETAQADLDKLRASAPPVEAITDEQWLSFETTRKTARAQADKIYGKDVVSKKIAEAKARRGR